MNLKQRIFRALAVGTHVVVGDGFHVGPLSRLWAPQRLTVGDDVYIGRFVSIEVDGSIGDGTMIANNVGIVGRNDHDIKQVGSIVRKARRVTEDPSRLSRPVVVGSDVWIGFGAVVLSGVVIGDSAVVAAGSVIVKDVPENTIVGGNPAQHIGSRFSEADYAAHWRQLERKGYRRMRGAQP